MSYSFPSSGDPEEDARELARIERHERLLAEGQCPNACGPMVRTDVLGYHAKCPECRFGVHSNTPEWAFLPRESSEVAS
mgnify:CR=1 FL=1